MAIRTLTIQMQHAHCVHADKRVAHPTDPDGDPGAVRPRWQRNADGRR